MKDLTDQELVLMLEMINSSTVRGQHVEIVAELKRKLLTEIDKRQNEKTKIK